MKKLLLILAITLMVIANWNFVKAFDCPAPNWSGSQTFVDSVNSSCSITINYCYYCSPMHAGADNLKIHDISFSNPACATTDIYALILSAEQQVLGNWMMLCGVLPCDQPTTYTFDLYTPVCVQFTYDGVTVDMVTCSTDEGNYCKQTFSMCWNPCTPKPCTDKVRWTIVEDAHLVGTPNCNVETEQEFQDDSNAFWKYINDHPGQIYKTYPCSWQPCKSVPCPY